MEDAYLKALYKPIDNEKIIELGNKIFKEGHLELVDDLLVELMPLAHIVYYKYVKYMDDREEFKQDLINDALLALYRDFQYRWDKYIRLDTYSGYMSKVMRNTMTANCARYHSNGWTEIAWDEEVFGEIPDPHSTIFTEDLDDRDFTDSFRKSVYEYANKLISCRVMNKNLLIQMMNYKYIKKNDRELKSLLDRVRVIGIDSDLINLYHFVVDYTYQIALSYMFSVVGGETKQSMHDRLAGIIDRFEDNTYKILSKNYYNTIIPEIYAEYGLEFTKKFVKTFSNQTIRIPDYRSFCDDVLGGLVLSLCKGNKDNLKDVSDQYHIPYYSLLRIYSRAMRESSNKEGDNIDT